jgi:hypothetical protein
MRTEQLMNRMRHAELGVHGDRDRLHDHMRTQKMGNALLNLRVGALDVGLHSSPKPLIVVRRKDRPGGRRLAELNG